MSSSFSALRKLIGKPSPNDSILARGSATLNEMPFGKKIFTPMKI